jgi:flagellar rod protein FlaI
MHLVNEFTDKLAELRDSDHKIMQLLSVEELIAEDIEYLVDTREQLLQSLLDMINVHPQLAQQPQWKEAITSTQTVVKLMQLKTAEFGLALKKYRHGKRSVQQYQKFL